MNSRLNLVGALLAAMISHVSAADIDFSPVRDDAPIGHEDNAPYYALLKAAAKVDQRQLRADAVQFLADQQAKSQYSHLPPHRYPLFTQMLAHPDQFRGRPVLLKGHVLRVDAYDAGANPHGIDRLHECWLVTEDAEHHPCTVIFTDKPAGLVLGEDPIDGVEVAGYFLKNHSYPAADHRTRKAPLILARTITITPPPTMGNGVNSLVLGAFLISGLGLSLGLAAVLQYRERWRVARLRAANSALPRPDFSGWDGSP